MSGESFLFRCNFSRPGKLNSADKTMNPLEPNDPLWDLLGKTRKVEVRGNFLQNVVRAARQEPQQLSVWTRLMAWAAETRSAGWVRPAMVAAAVVMAGVALWSPASRPDVDLVQADGSAVGMTPLEEDLELLKLAESLPTMPLESVNQMDVLLAMDNTAALTDTELAFLLY
jgi:hypothetical protein